MESGKNSAFAHVSLGLELAAIMLVFVYGGYKIDVIFNKTPLFICLGSAIGMVGGFCNLMRALKSMEKTMKENKEKTETEKPVKWM